MNSYCFTIIVVRFYFVIRSCELCSICVKVSNVLLRTQENVISFSESKCGTISFGALLGGL